MLFKTTHYPVNWVDGMKISKDHFIDSTNYLNDIIRDVSSISITSFNYGLLTNGIPSKNSFDIEFEIKENIFCTVFLKKCHAVTIGGFKISYDAKENDILSITKEFKGNSPSGIANNEIIGYSIILVANPFQRKPIGIPSSDEMPPRHPYSDTHYEIQIIPSDQINLNELGSYCFLIGKLKNNKEGHISVNENFIPACSSLQSHYKLIEFHTFCVNHIRHIKQISLGIIKKIQVKNKPSSLTTNFHFLCERILSHITTIYYSLLNELPEKEPIQLIGCIATLANVHYNVHQCICDEEREEFLKYIFEWTDLSPTETHSILLNTCNVKYNHLAINESIELISKYLDMTRKIWDNLNALEFIGQHKENIVVTKETIHINPEQQKKRWSILD